jgi:probable phosphoglycerate mutase
MAARLLLVRHGQIEANLEHRWHGSTDHGLTAHGREEAERVAAYLARARPNVVAVYTSPLQRASDTARLIATELHAPLLPAAGLAEYGIGVLENETFADLAARHRFFEQADDLAWAPPGGESLGAVGTRVLEAWRMIAAAHPHGEVVLVSHGAAIAIGIARLLHDDPRAWTRYRVRNTSVTELELEPVPRLLAFDVVEHLE